MTDPIPSVVEVMAEYGPCLGDRSPGGVGSVAPIDLGISAALIERLDRWIAERGQRALGLGATDGSASSADWQRKGLVLTHQLQAEVDALGHDIDVLYFRDDDPRTLRERRVG